MLEQIGIIFGYLAVAGGCFIYVGKTRKALAITKFSVESLWLISYILQGGLWTMLILTVIALARQVVFYYKYSKKWASSPLWLYAFLLLTCVSPVIEILDKGFSLGLLATLLLPTIGSIFIIFVYYTKNPITAKKLGLPSSLLYFSYAIVTKQGPLIASGIIGIPITVTSLVLHIRDEKRKNLLDKQQIEGDKND